MKLKLCGLKRLEDIEYVNEFLPDYAGFVFAESKRKVSPDLAESFIKKLNSSIKTVGIFVNEDIDRLASTAVLAGLSVVQLHGDEDARYISRVRQVLPGIEIWKAVRVRNVFSIIVADSLPVDKILLDTFSMGAYGGTGNVADLELIKRVCGKIVKPFFMAGGLNVDNIENTVNEVSPFGVDISSGIEIDGCKDREKIKAVVELVRGMR